MCQPVRFALVWQGWRLRPPDDIIAPMADDPDRFRERVGKIVKHKPVEKPE
jgi:hypothetical protein